MILASSLIFSLFMPYSALASASDPNVDGGGSPRLDIIEPTWRAASDFSRDNPVKIVYPVVMAPKDTPNVVIIMIDDLGFAGTSVFGGVTSTPIFYRLTEEV